MCASVCCTKGKQHKSTLPAVLKDCCITRSAGAVLRLFQSEYILLNGMCGRVPLEYLTCPRSANCKILDNEGALRLSLRQFVMVVR